MCNVGIKTDWRLRLLLSVLCLKVQLPYFWHNTQRYFYQIFWWNNEDILKLKVPRVLVILKDIYRFSIKKPKMKHWGKILKWYLGHKNKPLCFANCDFSQFNINVILFLCHDLIKKCNSNDVSTKQRVEKWNPKTIRFVFIVSQLSIPWFLFYLVKMARW